MAVKGLTETSSLIEVSFSVTESGANTFTENRVDLQLNPLDNEVFIVYAANLDPFNPDMVTGVDTSVLGSVTRTSVTSAANLGDPACIATANHSIRSDPTNAVAILQKAGESPPTTLPYIAIIATNDFFVQVEGVGNLGAKAVKGRLYGVRAKASSSIYAALVQSELLS
jgi:hypothetical protein